MAIGSTNSGGGGLNKSLIIVTDLPAGSTVTATPLAGGPVKKAVEKNGQWWLRNLDLGEWILKATLGDESETIEYNIDRLGIFYVPMSYVKIYGIKRDITNQSPEWERTDAAVGFTATASVGTVAGQSSFDNKYPWSGIQREVVLTGTTGDVMVKIPKFWFKRYREGNVERIQIADKKTDGFDLHPAFDRYGVQKNCIYVGAYKTSNNNRSITNATPQVDQTRGTFRNNAKNKGTGWGIIDIGAVSAIQMLALVEFANYNVQDVIGRGYCDENSTVLQTGSCDNVPNLTGVPAGTPGKVDVVWRGLEGLWGNVYEFVDGVNFNGGKYYVCYNPDDYADDTSEGYKTLSYNAPAITKGYVTELGLDQDNTHIMLPSAAAVGSGTTYICDYAYINADGWRTYANSLQYHQGSQDGLFGTVLAYLSSYTYIDIGSRLMYIPEVA